VLLAQRFLRPVHALAQTAERIQAGDLGARVEEAGGAEEMCLMKQFNSMAASLQKRHNELEAAYSELESFSYSISHDLRTPLRAIDGYTNILMEDYPDVIQGEVKEYFEKVIHAADRMGNLIDNLLHLSVISKKALVYEKVDISEIAKEIAVELKESEPERQAEFVIEGGLTVTGDKVLLIDVMENLLGNGWKFSSKKRAAVIEFGTAVVEGEKVFFVRDNGAGFDSRYAHKLFGPFQRLHAESEFPGTGIGLATVARILQKHGGRIWAESVLDRGATFFFTIG
jgi:light-regulated signal transduction histidine kinase (bacteriophytochrome)